MRIVGLLPLGVPRLDDPDQARGALAFGADSLTGWMLRSMARAGIAQGIIVADRVTPAIRDLIDGMASAPIPVSLAPDASVLLERCAADDLILLVEEGLAVEPGLLTAFLAAAREAAGAGPVAAVAVWPFSAAQADTAYRLNTTSSFAGLVLLPAQALAAIARDLGDWDLVQTCAQVAYREASARAINLAGLGRSAADPGWQRLADANAAQALFADIATRDAGARPTADRFLFGRLADAMGRLSFVNRLPTPVLALLPALIALLGPALLALGLLAPGLGLLVAGGVLVDTAHRALSARIARPGYLKALNGAIMAAWLLGLALLPFALPGGGADVSVWSMTALLAVALLAHRQLWVLVARLRLPLPAALSLALLSPSVIALLLLLAGLLGHARAVIVALAALHGAALLASLALLNRRV